MKKLLIIITLLFNSLAIASPVTPMFPGPGMTNSGVVPIGAPVLIASAQSNAATTTANAPAGSVIIVCVADTNAATVSAISDGVNTYTQQARVPATGTTCFTSGILGAQLNSGATITATITSSSNPSINVAYVTGLSSATKDALGTSATANVNTVTTSTGLAQANELAIGFALYFNSGSSTGTPTETSGFTSLKQFVNYGGAVFTTDFAYKIVNSTSAVTFSNGGVTSAGAANVLVFTLKGN